MVTLPGAERTGFRRDRITVAFYGVFAVWGWLLYSFNPSVPLLADDLGISDAQAGLHGTAMAVGAILAAFVTPRLVRGRGRRTAVVASVALIALGVVALVLAPTLAWSLTAIFVVSVGGNAALTATQPGLALRHGRASSAALTEANGVGSSIGLVGPLAVGACVAIGWGWRPAVLVTAALAVVCALMLARIPVGGAMTPAHQAPAPEPAVSDTPVRRSALPVWCFLATLVAAVGMEFATTYWATGLVIEHTDAGAGIAAATTAGLVLGMSVIRFVVGPLSLRIAPARLLTGAFVLAIGGWAILWTATTPAVAMLGLVVSGLGYGAQYPLSVALLLATAPHRPDAIQGRATLAAGLAVGVAPFALGALADQFGTHQAFILVPVVAVAGAVAAALGGRAVRLAVTSQADVVALGG
ncbi:sugar MFS transporter [Cellulomonas sp. URHD0024]|uniref:MFS transporter n=1 Tax=Cellulomonas sp. URHD0024 TaxID=1302620 RepID=UPI00040C22B2|nr:MFS transporter [Cellulomonas sp. URHD0024]